MLKRTTALAALTLVLLLGACDEELAETLDAGQGAGLDLELDARPDALTDGQPPDGILTDAGSSDADALTDAAGSAGDGAAASGTPTWLLHLTDTHIGASSFATKALTAAVKNVITVISPTSTIVTGDITEGGKTAEWQAYEKIVKGQVPAYPTYLEVPGNHDMKTISAGNFQKYSQTGKAKGDLYGMSYVGSGADKVRVVRTNTADSTNAQRQLLGYFSSAQKANLLATKPPSGTTYKHTVVAAHHPVVGLVSLATLGTAKEMKDLLVKTKAEVYLTGHVHTRAITWVKDTLMVQTNTLGKPNILTPNSVYMLVGLDSTGPSVRPVALSKGNTVKVSWPVTLITTPAQADLGLKNPLAKNISPGSAMTVRALAFSAKGVTKVEVRVESGSWAAMSSTAKPIWQAAVTAPTATGKRTLEVKSTSPEGTDTHKIKFLVGN